MINNPRTLIRIDSVDSTNNYAAKPQVLAQLVDNTVIVAREQTNGRGQRGKTWLTEAGKNLTMTWVRKSCGIKAGKQFYISIAVSLALVETLKSYAMEAKIKWPNDIYIGREKVAGILIENTLQGSSIAQSLIGIGLNVNQSEFEVESATSMSLQLEKQLDKVELTSELMNNCDKYWHWLASSKWEELTKEYDKHSVLIGKTIHENGELGTIAGVDESGRLLIDFEDVRKAFAHVELKKIVL